MSDVEADGEPGDEDIHQRHRREQKALQAHIAALKRTVTKGDKKRKKEVQAEIALMEAEMQARHEKDLEANQNDVAAVDTVDGSVTNASCENGTGGGDDVGRKTAKISKAQKRRDKKATLERERDQLILEEQQQAPLSNRQREFDALQALLTVRGLQMHHIESDGNCLYNAIAHQMSQLPRLGTVSVNGATIRSTVANYMRSHKEDFLPFLLSPEGEMLTEEGFAAYCDQVEGLNGPVWGGQPELRAFSLAFRQPVEVLQADSPPIHFGEHLGDDSKKLVITFHRHAYQLGEHYNSTELADDDADNISFQ